MKIMSDRELFYQLFKLDADSNGIHVSTDKVGRKRTITVSTLYPDPDVLKTVWKECGRWLADGR